LPICHRHQIAEPSAIEKLVSVSYNVHITSEDRREQLYSQVTHITNTLRRRGVHLDAAVKRSIALYFTCSSLSGLFYLEDLHSTGQLRVVLSSLFSELIGNDRYVTVYNLRWKMCNHMACVEYLSDSFGLERFAEMYRLSRRLSYSSSADCDTCNRSVLGRRVNVLPSERLEVIFVRAAGQHFVKFNTLSPAADIYTLLSLGAVSQVWYRTLFNRK
jgi:hypothetical protein